MTYIPKGPTSQRVGRLSKEDRAERIAVVLRCGNIKEAAEELKMRSDTLSNWCRANDIGGRGQGNLQPEATGLNVPTTQTVAALRGILEDVETSLKRLQSVRQEVVWLLDKKRV